MVRSSCAASLSVDLVLDQRHALIREREVVLEVGAVVSPRVAAGL
jgi:hypothetical protein